MSGYPVNSNLNYVKRGLSFIHLGAGGVNLAIDDICDCICINQPQISTALYNDFQADSKFLKCMGVMVKHLFPFILGILLLCQVVASLTVNSLIQTYV